MATAAGPAKLGRHTFASRDCEETRAFLRGKDFDFSIAARDTSQLDAHIDGFDSPGMYIGRMRYGCEIAIEATAARNDYWLHLPTAGSFEARVRGTPVGGNHRQALVLNPGSPGAFRSAADSRRMSIALAPAVVERQLAALLHERPCRPLEFSSTLNLERGFGRSLARFVYLTLENLGRPDCPLQDALTRQEFGEFVVAGALLSIPNNYSDSLHRATGRVVPRDVRAAIDYIHAHLTGPIVLADIVAASGVAGRTLFKHFRVAKGVTPMRYVRDARLDLLHDMLRAGPTARTITELATSLGFTHMGRFAAEYRRRFGSTPSSMVRRERFS